MREKAWPNSSLPAAALPASGSRGLQLPLDSQPMAPPLLIGRIEPGGVMSTLGNCSHGGHDGHNGDAVYPPASRHGVFNAQVGARSALFLFIFLIVLVLTLVIFDWTGKITIMSRSRIMNDPIRRGAGLRGRCDLRARSSLRSGLRNDHRLSQVDGRGRGNGRRDWGRSGGRRVGERTDRL